MVQHEPQKRIMMKTIDRFNVGFNRKWNCLLEMACGGYQAYYTVHDR
jgi:hypothetical protein